MKVYKCDICCKKIADSYYSLGSDSFDISAEECKEYHMTEQRVEFRNICGDCHERIKNFIHLNYLKSKYF